MKKLLLYFVLSFGYLFAGTPIIDGNFDGEGVWGLPIYVADGTAGWATANAKKVYLTVDATNVYFGAQVSAAEWMSCAFILNTKTGGGSADSWLRQINFLHVNKPDFTLRGTFGGYCENHFWSTDSLKWMGVGTSKDSTFYRENIVGNTVVDGWVELKVPRSYLGNITTLDVQFYITGDQNDHGSFDACPNDSNSAGWNPPTSITNLSKYINTVGLPVELTSFSASANGNSVVLNWATATEVNNKGFEVQRCSNGFWTTIGFIKGNGTSTSENKYSYADRLISNGRYSYRLKQVDYNGNSSFSNEVEVSVSDMPLEYSLEQNYPNPFNPSTIIKFSQPIAGYTSLKIYDVTGKVVKTLFQGIIEAGTHQLEFNSEGISSGVYFYRLESGTFNSIRKLVVLK